MTQNQLKFQPFLPEVTQWQVLYNVDASALLGQSRRSDLSFLDLDILPSNSSVHKVLGIMFARQSCL